MDEELSKPRRRRPLAGGPKVLRRTGNTPPDPRDAHILTPAEVKRAYPGS